MSLIDRLLGVDAARRPARPLRPDDEDRRAVDRYRSLLRTARPDEVERVHAEAFAKLTPAQRRQVFTELSRSAQPGDRPWSADPDELATSATRSELRRPGFLERTLGTGVGGGLAGSLLGAVAGFAIGSVVAETVLPGIGDLASGAFEQVHDLADGGVEVVHEAGTGFADLFGEWGSVGDLEF